MCFEIKITEINNNGGIVSFKKIKRDVFFFNYQNCELFQSLGISWIIEFIKIWRRCKL